MKKVVLISVLSLCSSGLFAQEIPFTGTGVYQLGEFDSINSAKSIAEQKAFESISEQVTDRVLSIKSMDSNGYLSRASWLLNGATISSRRTDESIGACVSEDGTCATVSVKAVIDTELADKVLKQMYLDKKVQQVLEKLIVEDERFESYVLNGDSIDVAKLKERQSKRNEIVELISRLPESKTARSVDTEFLEDLLTEKGKYDLKQIGKENKKTTYKALLGKLKENVSYEIVQQVPVVNSDGTSGVRLKLKVSTDGAEDLVEWVTKELGVSEGDWSDYPDTRVSTNNKVFTYHPGTAVAGLQDAITVTQLDDNAREPGRYLVGYGVDNVTYDKASNKIDGRLDPDKIAVLKALSKYRVCSEISLLGYEIGKQCIAGGAGNSQNEYVSPVWDKATPYVWFTKDNSEFNVYVPLSSERLRDTEKMRKLSLSYTSYVTTD
ncbi:hypothetical protein P3602_24570 [Vibrio parahaemolyticus]|nr:MULTISPECIES: hypothetical protein [Vibrio]MDF5109069.1 hypothetical protein [Vibrio parahaemolyticus]MCA2420916.1 hypothetical protein [Vibrio alginolyticus]MCA2445691.1 hypothetical protein [Vibrio alginolyticus]MDF5143993.1 hypothetical protein [Vibrio parahaemolyticus]MDF5154420.1 hypothetical protein [Vibrio parahaemolyticus]